MTIPSFTAEASLYATGRQYRFAAARSPGRFDSVLAQQEGCMRLGQRCRGNILELSCCPGLECSGGLGPGICVPCPPCGPCHADLTSGGCNKVCYESFPPRFPRCFPVSVPCDPSSEECCNDLKRLCIANNGTIDDCHDHICGAGVGCICCPEAPCCFNCM